jgi:DNA-binding MarR family transcriptional regulator
MTPPPADKAQLAERLIAAFRDAGNVDSAFETLAAARLGINPTDMRCINSIENAGGLSPGALGRELGITSGAVTGVVDRLEKAGFARRIADPADRRRVTIEVTPEFYKQAEPIWGPLAADWQGDLLDRFNKADLERIIEFLEQSGKIGRRHLARLSDETVSPRC